MPRLLAVLTFITTSALRAVGPDSAIVVVNGDSWASLRVANEYAAARGIPQGNFIVLRDVPSFEHIGVQDFREKILGPVLAIAERRGLAQQLDAVLYSADFPWAVDVTPDMAGKTFPKQITQPASLTGLTYLYQFVLGKNPAYLGMNTNFYHRQVSRIAPESPWPEADQKRYHGALIILQQISTAVAKEKERALSDDEKRRLREVRDTMLALRPTHAASTELLYNLACVHARLGEGEEAIAALRAAMGAGWWDMRHAQADPDLASLRERADFKDLAAKARAVKFEMTPTSGFRGSVGWAPTGAAVPGEKGARYMLSTMLACTSGRGTSVGEAIDGLRRSATADGTAPKGTIYFPENGDVRSTARAWGTGRAAEKLRELGIAAVVEKGVLPQKRGDVAGVSVGAADFDWAASGSTLLPGAIAEHLTSFGGVMTEGAGQTPLSEFLRHGAAGASGTVTEPYAIQAKFPSPFIHWHYAQGVTLAEAFYQSVHGPYQLLIVGDALCAPWRKKITVTAKGLAAGAELKGALTLRPEVSDGMKAGLFELFLDGRRVAMAKPGEALKLDTTKAADGHHTMTIVASAADAISAPARVAVPVIIRNAPGEFITTANARGDWPWDKPVEFTTRAPGASGIIFLHLGREVARVTGAEGTAKLDPRVLGQGPVRVQPVAIREGKEVAGAPLEFRIVPPAPLPAATPPALADGLHVIPAGAGPVVAAKADGDWLAKAGVQKDGEFAVESWFSVGADDVFQFQLHGPRTLRVFVDGQAQDAPRGKEWWFIPVALAKGAHKLRIEGKADGAPRLDARFGGPGSYKLASPRFRRAE